VRADNYIKAAGAASLAPSLGRMTQLTSLDLNCTLRASAAAGAVSGLLANAGVRGWCVLRVGRLRATLQRVVGLARGEPRGGGCVQTMTSE
jgi:hypothetical protein